MEQHRGHQGDGGHPGQHLDIVRRDPEGIAEQDSGQRPRIGRGPGDENHAESQHSHEEQPDAGVLREGGLAVDEVDAEDHDGGGQAGSDHDVEVEQYRQRDAGDDAVDEGIAEERHAPDHHPGSDQGQRDGGQ